MAYGDEINTGRPNPAGPWATVALGLGLATTLVYGFPKLLGGVAHEVAGKPSSRISLLQQSAPGLPKGLRIVSNRPAVPPA